MKKFKKLLAGIMTLCMIATALPVTAMAAGGPVCIDGLWYNITDAGANVTAVPEGETAYTGVVNVPEKISYNGTEYTVIGVEGNAFNNDFETVTEITVPNSVTSLGGAAFANMDSLEKITIGNGVKSWGNKLAVNNDNLETVIIAEGATLIGDLAFRSCPKLANVTLPSTLEKIGATAFAFSAISELTIPASVKAIGSDAFKDCPSLKKVTILSVPETFGTTVFQQNDALQTVVLPEGLKEIPQGTFRYNTALKNINFPESLEVIGNYAFQGCTALETVTITKEMKSIVTNAFNGCTSLKNLTIEEGFAGSIGGYAFQGCTALESVKIPSTMETVGESMFNMCSGLKEVTLSEGVKTLNISAFANCTSLESITFPDSLERIRHGSIANCTNLTEIIIVGEDLPVIEHSNALEGLRDDIAIYYSGDDAFTGNWTRLEKNVIDPNAVARVGSTCYETLAAAVGAANAVEGGTVITLLKDVNLGEKLTISKDVTIKGNATITRADNYTGTLFEVFAGAKLALDGGLVLDGANKWTFNENQYKEDLANGVYVDTGFNHYVVTENETAPIATAAMFNVKGSVVMEKATIKNHMGNSNQRLFYLNGTSALTLNDGATITHCATAGKATVAYLDSADSVLTIKNGAMITDNYGSQHAALIRCEKGTFNMTGGEISQNYAAASNGSVLVMRSGAVFNMTGGEISGNSSVQGNGGSNTPCIMLYNGAVMNISGGSIQNNTGYVTGGILSQNGATLNISGESKIIRNVALGQDYAAYNDIYGGNGTVITGGTFTQKIESSWLKNGYVLAENSDGTYGVERLMMVEMDGKQYATIKDALATLRSADTTVHTVKVLRDHEIDVNYSTYNYPVLINGFKVVLDLNGKKITADWSKYAGTRADNALIGICNGGKLTIVDSSREGTGMIINKDDGKDAVQNRIFWVMTSTATKSAELTIEDGTFIQQDNINLLYVQGNKPEDNLAPIYVNVDGGNFRMENEKWTDFFNSYDGYQHNTVISGGIFNVNPTDWEIKFPEGFEAGMLKEGLWGVVEKLEEGDTGYTIVYTDGVDGEEAFADQVTKNVVLGADTPAFVGTPFRAGYTFKGWSPVVSEYVDRYVTYTAQWEEIPVVPSAPSTGGGGGGSTKYSVSIDKDEIENGTVKLSSTRAVKGSTVTITVTPDVGYALDELKVLDKDGKEVELTDKGDGKFTFKMPRGGVEIEASFKKIAEDVVVDKPAIEETTLVLTIGQAIYQLNGEYKANDVAPIIKADRTFLPIRLVAEALGATVTWNEADQSVTIVEGDTTIVIYIGQAFALVNGNPVQLDAPAFIANSRTYLPVRFVAENLGANVSWDGTAQTVTIIG